MVEIATTLKKETQICKSCGKELPLSAYRSGRLGLLKTCKECVRQHQVKARLDKKIAMLQSDEVEKTKKMRLADFTPRELMAELKRRGYKFKMEYVETHIIDSKDIEI